MRFWPEAQEWPFAFAPPTRVDVFAPVGGVQALGSCPTVLLEMPGDAFQSKDYLNGRYLSKRAACADAWAGAFQTVEHVLLQAWIALRREERAL